MSEEKREQKSEDIESPATDNAGSDTTDSVDSRCSLDSSAMPGRGSKKSRGEATSNATPPTYQRGEGLELWSVTAQIGTLRKSHGLQVFFHGRLDSQSGLTSRDLKAAMDSNSKAYLTLDFMGPWDKALNPVFATAARWFFPFKLGRRSWKQFHFNDGVLSGNIGLGMRRLSEATIMSSLDDQINGGDPVLVLRITLVTANNKSFVLFDVPTKCSLIKASLETSGTSVVYGGPVPDYVPSTASLVFQRAYTLFRWALWPTAFVACTYAVGYVPQAKDMLTDWVPDIFSLRPGAGGSNDTLIELLPPDPRLKSEAFVLGQLEERLSAAERALQSASSAGVEAATEAIKNILVLAAETIDRATVTAEELHGTLEHLKLLDATGSTIAEKVWGAVSFVNMIWLAGIFGIAISIGPSIYHLLRPLRMFLRRVIKWIADHILIPLAKQCHKRGVFEMLAWAGCGCLLVNSLYHRNLTIQLYFALTSAALAVPAAGYTTLLQGPNFIKKRTIVQIGQAWFAIVTALLAVQHESLLFSYTCIACLYSLIGFHAACGSLCWMIGFEDKDGAVRCAVASLLLLSGFTAAKIAAIDNSALHTFASPVSVLGSNVLFLALMIIASKYTYPARHNRRALSYVGRNILMVGALLLAWGFGFVWGMPGMSTTATVYAVLFGMEKYIELHMELKWNGWVLMLLLSAVMWRGSLYVHANPSILLSLFNPFEAQ